MFEFQQNFFVSPFPRAVQDLLGPYSKPPLIYPDIVLSNRAEAPQEREKLGERVKPNEQDGTLQWRPDSFWSSVTYSYPIAHPYEHIPS